MLRSRTGPGSAPPARARGGGGGLAAQRLRHKDMYPKRLGGGDGCRAAVQVHRQRFISDSSAAHQHVHFGSVAQGQILMCGEQRHFTAGTSPACWRSRDVSFSIERTVITSAVFRWLWTCWARHKWFLSLQNSRSFLSVAKAKWLCMRGVAEAVVTLEAALRGSQPAAEQLRTRRQPARVRAHRPHHVCPLPSGVRRCRWECCWRGS